MSELQETLPETDIERVRQGENVEGIGVLNGPSIRDRVATMHRTSFVRRAERVPASTAELTPLEGDALFALRERSGAEAAILGLCHERAEAKRL